MMLAPGEAAVSISIASSRSATVKPSLDDGSWQPHRCARGLREVERLERRRGPSIAIGQGLEPEAPRDQLQDGGVIVLTVADEDALHVERQDQDQHASPMTVAVTD